MQRLFIDFVGPLVRTHNGNTVILAMVDGFSKFVWLFAFREMTSKLVIKTLNCQVFAQNGVPESIVTDNATVFTSKIFNDMCFQCGIRHVTTSPYYTQPNLMERFNRNLKSALIVFHLDHQLAWDEHLHALQLGFNSTYHEATKSTPAELFLGRSLNHPLQLQWKLKLEEPMSQTELEAQWRDAIRNLRDAKRKNAVRYNAVRQPHKFLMGNRVRVRVFPQSSAPNQVSGKLMFRWSQPLTISRFLSPVTVELSCPDTGRPLRKAHVPHLKLVERERGESRPDCECTIELLITAGLWGPVGVCFILQVLLGVTTYSSSTSCSSTSDDWFMGTSLDLGASNHRLQRLAGCRSGNLIPKQWASVSGVTEFLLLGLP
ncbi:hypothetical protein ANN_13749 [Periplaneta americana]|uniref:Integrase catalytic domain-containing protein n=1 Tax=Periplaneta americana TaxID=6978 RepID=A0ABQ8SVL3_PERAM|nr:hypothetical protein ANN_13749 [Periplaneta americana]